MFKINFKVCVTVAALCLIWSIPDVSRADDGLIVKIQAHYQKATSLSGEFKQSLLHKESNARTEQSGKLAFRKPLLVRWEVTTPRREELIVVNAEEVWNYIPYEEVAYKYPVALVQDSRTMIKVITGQADLAEDFKVRPAGREGDLNKLTLIPREATQQITLAEIWVSDDGIIKRAMIQDFFGNQNDIAFSRLDFDLPMQDGMFKFSPPMGVEVLDHSAENTAQPQEHRLFQ